MNVRGLVIASLGVALSRPALGGGFFIPGQGPISTARGGTAVASAQDGEAISMNPAGIAHTTGTVVQIGIVGVDYSMSFTRAGSYDPIAGESVSYAGQSYPTISNTSKPLYGIGSYQPLPVIAVVSDLGNRIPGLRAGLAIFPPQSYPFRNMNTVNGKPYFTVGSNGGYAFPSSGDAPPPSRYDAVYQDAQVILPSLAVAYRALPQLDIGARVSTGFAGIKAAAALWGQTNYEEWIKADGLLTVDAKDNFVFTYGLGALYRPTPSIEVGANFNGPMHVNARGDAYAATGAEVKVAGMGVEVGPIEDALAKCAKGGTADTLKACIDIQLPISAQVGGRYKFIDAASRFRGDVELNLGWEHWGAKCDYAKDPTCLDPSDFRLRVDARASVIGNPDLSVPLSEVRLPHGLRDTYSARLGGSYVVPLAGDAVVIRGGVGYDTAAAKKGWERVDLDGAARLTLAAGGSYKLATWSIDAGFGVILEGTRTANRNCNPTTGQQGCAGAGSDAPLDDRQGPDPINPVFVPIQQVENPVNQGTMSSHYLMWMIGASHRF